MEFNKQLLKHCTNIDIIEYLYELNKISNNPISNTLLFDLYDYSISDTIHHSILYKYNIIPSNTNIEKFLKIYVDKLNNQGSNFYFTSGDFKNILLYESNILYNYYMDILRYKEFYNIYKSKLNEILHMRYLYLELNNILTKIYEYYDKIFFLKNDNELDKFLENEINDLKSMETDIANMKTEILNKINRSL